MVKLVMPDDGQVQNYLDAISLYDREFKNWEGRVEKILKRYRDDDRSDKGGSAKFNILWKYLTEKNRLKQQL